MPDDSPHGLPTIAMLGNPNTGKTTLFNALSGDRGRVGNYPGVTVEYTLGQVQIDGQTFRLIDLPGTYSLAPRSLDEMVTVDVLLGRAAGVAKPDLLLCIIDASNLERNLYLVSQALGLGMRTLVVLNKVDVAEEQGVQIDIQQLQDRLPVPIVVTQAHRGQGVEELKAAIRIAAATAAVPHADPFPASFRDQVDAIERATRQVKGGPLPRYLTERLLLDGGVYLETARLGGVDSTILRLVKTARENLAEDGHPVPAVETVARYDWVAQVLEGSVRRTEQQTVTVSDRLDETLTHKVWGTLIFIVLMVVVFQAIFAGADPLISLVEAVFSWLGGQIENWLPDGALRSLLVNGVIAGAGSVLSFLPQIFVLFFLIAILEDCGYMSRAAYLTDKLMSRIGLSGKSFIPLLSSFACAVPGIMAARVIEDRRDRLVTILVAPLMSCSARLPIYTLLTAAFIPHYKILGGWLGLRGATMFSMYLLGIIAAVCVAFIMKRTLLKSDTPAFVMELPNYKLPSLRTSLHRATEQGWAFVRSAGTLILAVTIVVWAAAYFPHNPEVEQAVRSGFQPDLSRLEAAIAKLESRSADSDPGMDDAALSRLSEERTRLVDEMNRRVASAYLEQSYLGQAGKVIAPVVEPLGWDWRIGCAVIASFPAREVVIGTLGVIYNLGEDQDEHSQSLRQTLQEASWPETGEPIFNVPVALSLMVFYSLCAQCAATLAIMRRETASWRWPIFTFCYMTVLAYVGAYVTYHLGMLFVT